jgi:hypothetical protein
MCGQSYCIAHRLDMDHNCSYLQKKSNILAKKKKAKSKALATQNNSDKKKQLPSEVSNIMKHKASNNSKPEEFSLKIDITVSRYGSSHHMSFPSNFIIREVLNHICSHNRIRQDPHKPIDIIAANSGSILPPEKTLAELHRSNLLSPGDTIIVIYANQQPSTDSSTGSYCHIM